jgi:hypothetical protein
MANTALTPALNEQEIQKYRDHLCSIDNQAKGDSAKNVTEEAPSDNEDDEATRLEYLRQLLSSEPDITAVDSEASSKPECDPGRIEKDADETRKRALELPKCDDFFFHVPQIETNNSVISDALQRIRRQSSERNVLYGRTAFFQATGWLVDVRSMAKEPRTPKGGIIFFNHSVAGEKTFLSNFESRFVSCPSRMK